MTTRMQRRSALWLLLACLLALLAPPAAAQAPDHARGVRRIVAVGDVHGGYDELVAILRAARVIDGRHQWAGGRAHLVQTGDVLDRGPDSRKVMDLLMRLESQARTTGGQVHALLGNHEVMNVVGDLRYVSAGEYAAFATRRSARVRDRAYEALADPARKDDPAYREQWMAERPLGWVEHRAAFGPEGRYGRWLRQRHAVVKIDDYLFVHGGISPALASMTVGDINEGVRAELRQQPAPGGPLTTGADGPFWYRGLAQADEEELRPHVEQVLAAHGVKHIVVGHTTTPGAVVPRFGGAVLLIDVGLSRHYGARPACLVVRDGAPFALHRGHLLALQGDGPGGLLAYLRAAARLDPDPSPLEPLIRAGGRLPLRDGSMR